ncbi:hypothetical protein FOCC_FOCC013468 [Frankliniella occidentalis]|nr:hypothetical protein FOCC_FOCC013468 [Frankliniella occidentalis]
MLAGTPDKAAQCMREDAVPVRARELSFGTDAQDGVEPVPEVEHEPEVVLIEEGGEEVDVAIPEEVFKRKRTRAKRPPTPAARPAVAQKAGPSFVQSTKQHPMGKVPDPVFHLPPPQPHQALLVDNVDMREVLNAKRARRAQEEGNNKRQKKD